MSRYYFVIPSVLLLLSACGKGRQPLTMQEELDCGNYQRVAEMARAEQSPDSVTSFYYYLACACMDALPDSLLSFQPKDLGTLHKVGESTPLPVINMMNDLYYHLGDMMYAERAAMISCVFAPGNIDWRMIRRLAQVNLVTGDTLAATKFLRVLSAEESQRQWAREHTPGTMSQEALDEIAMRRRFTNTKDTLRLGDNCRTILLELLESNPENTMALDYLLCTSLLLKEMDTFKADYDRFCMDSGRPRLKRLYQQALMIYLAGTGAPQEDWERYIKMPEQLARFAEYGRQRGNPAFNDTYWYYFDMTR